jgi:hypothetical protein
MIKPTKQILKACVLLATLSLTVGSVRAVSVTWNGSSSFSDASISFAGFTANELTSFTGDGYFHTHGFTTTNTLDILLDGSWTNIWSAQTLGSNTTSQYLVSILPTPISFNLGIVSGIRLTGNPNLSANFHGWTSVASEGGIDDVFTFNTVAVTSVPEGGSTALMMGLTILGFCAVRRRRA